MDPNQDNVHYHDFVKTKYVDIQLDLLRENEKISKVEDNSI